MGAPMARRRTWLALALSLGCTDAGLYAVNAQNPSRVDRADFAGTVCVPMATGEAFPVKVLFAIQGGDPVSRSVVGQVVDALNSLTSRFSTPEVKLSLVAFHTVATGLAGSFTEAANLQPAIAKYNSYQEQGPVSLRAPLRLATSLVSGDMQTGCRGAVARTRYLVVLVVASGDTSCANPVFNANIDAKCDALYQAGGATAAEDCSSCELRRVTNELKGLAEQYGAGDVVIQPVYIQDAPVPNDPVLLQIDAIARAGGTEQVITTSQNLKSTLNGLDYASLQRALILKRFIAFNRNAVAREGRQATDSDGDGLSDDTEATQLTDAVSQDSDKDGLMDSVEVRMGMDPRVQDTVNACNPFLDTDSDGLNDCEEKVLGTDPCISDSDGDGLPDVVELLSQTSLLIPEDLTDGDRDGVPNVDEVIAHSDPATADLAYRADRGYRYRITDAKPTVDGRPCYEVRVENVSVVATRARPDPPREDIPAGMNDVYLFFEVGRANDPHGMGIGSVFVRPVQLVPPKNDRRDPPGTVEVTPDDFKLDT